MGRRGVALAVCVACVAMLSLEAAPDRTKTKAGVAPAKNDTLIRYYASDPDYINPLLASDTVSREFMRWVYQPLGRRKDADPDTVEPIVAESWTFDKEKLEYTIKIRKGIKWHAINLPSGKTLEPKELTARDVKFTFDTLLNPSTLIPGARAAFENPDSKDASDRYLIKVSVVDNSTVKVKWLKPYFNMEEATMDVDILPRHVFSVDKDGKPISFDFTSAVFAKGFNEHWANSQMCGTGPLLFREWTKGKQVVFERNPDYWGNPYYFSRVVFQYISNPNTALEKVKKNELDWAVIPEKDQYLATKEHEKVKSGAVVASEFPYPGYRYIGYNLKRPLFQDRKVRQALSHAVPVKDIIGRVMKGLADPVTGPAIPGSSAYDSSLPQIPHDLEKARALLDEAGWKDLDNDGFREKKINNQTIVARYDIIIFDNSPAFQAIAEIVKEENRKIGVDVLITVTKWDLMLQKLRKRDFDACMLGWAMSWKSDPLQIWHSNQVEVPDSSNAIGYANPEVDKIIDELRATVDLGRQNELFKELHRKLYEDQPYTFLFSELRTGFYDGRLQNIKAYKIRPCYDDSEWTAKTARMGQ